MQLKDIVARGLSLIFCTFLLTQAAGAQDAAPSKSVPPQLWEQIQKLVPFHGAGGDQFGYAVSVDGDTAVVGARSVDETAPFLDVGAACIFERNQGGPDNWGELKVLKGSGDDVGNTRTGIFGHAVFISGDTVVVGAPLDDVDGEIDAGAVYVFVRDQGGMDNWGEVKRIVASDAKASAQFGLSVGISGDTIVVGSRAPGGINPMSGAYIYDRNLGGPENWGEVKKRYASDAHFEDEFGFSVGIDGDTIVVGAPGHYEDGVPLVGAAYTFDRDYGGADNWGQVRKMTASDAMNTDQLGYSVAISGDTIVAGARFGDGNEIHSGSA